MTGSYENSTIKIIGEKDTWNGSVNVQKHVYKLNERNITDGDYLYVIRKSEPRTIWVAFTLPNRKGRIRFSIPPDIKENDRWYDDDDDDENDSWDISVLTHNCLAKPSEGVLAAGEMTVRGRKIKIDRNSGHYKPSSAHLKYACAEFRAKFTNYEIQCNNQ